MGMGRRRGIFQDYGRKWSLPALLYADNSVLFGDSEKDLKAMTGGFDKMCRRRGLKVNAGKGKVLALGKEEGVECEV